MAVTPTDIAPGRPVDPEGAPRYARPSASLIGRGNELQELTALASHPPAVIAIQGEAGIGKTRLVEEFARSQAPECKVLIGCCLPTSTPFMLGPVIDAFSRDLSLPANATSGLSQAVGALRPLLPELAEALPEPPSPLGDASAERHRIYRGLRELIASLGPVLLVLEDLHWADQSTLDFLMFLSNNMPPGLILVGTARDLETEEASETLESLWPRLGATRVSLAPLGPAEVGLLVGEILNAPEVSEDFAAFLHDRTTGIPFAVEEMLALLQGRGNVVQREGRWVGEELECLTVPPAIRTSMMERFARLPQDAQIVLQVASVMSDPTDEDVLREASELPCERFAAALNCALRVTMLEEDDSGNYSFHHALSQQAIYDALTGHERRSLHSRVASAMQSSRPTRLKDLARHFLEAHDTERAVHFVERAAADAAATHDYRGACWLLERAMHLPHLSATILARLALALGQSALECQRYDEAIVALDRALCEGSLAREVRGELRYALSLLLNESGSSDRAYEELMLAVEELQDQPRLAARAMRFLALPGLLKAPIDENVSWLRRVEIEAAKTNDPDLALMITVDKALTLTCADHLDAATAVSAIPDAPTSDGARWEIARGMTNMAILCLSLGRYDDAELFADRALLSHRPRMQVSLDMVDLVLMWRRGQWTGLESRAEAMLSNAHQFRAVTARAAIVKGALLRERGEIKRALASFNSVFDMVNDIGATDILGELVAELAKVKLASGGSEEALSLISQTFPRLADKGTWAWAELLPVAVEANVRCGRIEEAEFMLEEQRSRLQRRTVAPTAAAGFALAWGLIARALGDDSAIGHFKEALRLWAEMPCPYQVAQVHERLGCLSSDLGGHLRDALQIYARLGAAGDLARIKKKMRDRGITVPEPWRGGRKGYGNTLSPREAEVCRLAANGLTNREIGVELFLSPRTVGWHLSSAMRKLGITSRRDLRGGGVSWTGTPVSNGRKPGHSDGWLAAQG